MADSHINFLLSQCFFCKDDKNRIENFNDVKSEKNINPDTVNWFFDCHLPAGAKICGKCMEFCMDISRKGKKNFEVQELFSFL